MGIAPVCTEIDQGNFFGEEIQGQRMIRIL
jgi:hypothetical protein